MYDSAAADITLTSEHHAMQQPISGRARGQSRDGMPYVRHRSHLLHHRRDARLGRRRP